MFVLFPCTMQPKLVRVRQKCFLGHTSVPNILAFAASPRTKRLFSFDGTHTHGSVILETETGRTFASDWLISCRLTLLRAVWLIKIRSEHQKTSDDLGIVLPAEMVVEMLHEEQDDVEEEAIHSTDSEISDADDLDQGCQTHFHRGPHQHYGCPQRASCNYDVTSVTMYKTVF